MTANVPTDRLTRPGARMQRPGRRAQIDDRMKMHLRVLRLGGSTLRVITLRPDTKVAYATNYFHETWHILSDPQGARLLARLMWGLSYQRQPNTVVLIYGSHIVPTPFGSERSDPILLMRAEDNQPKEKTLQKLRQRLIHLGPSHQTVRWLTFGLDKKVEEDKLCTPGDFSRDYANDFWLWTCDAQRLRDAETMGRKSGFVCYRAPAKMMQLAASQIVTMQPTGQYSDYHYLAESDSRWPDGEVQIFSDFRQRCSAAKEARRDVLEQQPCFANPADLYTAVASRRDRILSLRRRQTAKRFGKRAQSV